MFAKFPWPKMSIDTENQYMPNNLLWSQVLPPSKIQTEDPIRKESTHGAQRVNGSSKVTAMVNEWVCNASDICLRSEQHA